MLPLTKTSAIVPNLLFDKTAIRTTAISSVMTEPSNTPQILHHPNATPPLSATQQLHIPTPDNPNIVMSCPTFAQWCQQAVLMKKIQCNLAHHKLVDYLLFTHKLYPRHINDIHAMDTTHTKFAKKFIPLMTYQLYPIKKSHLPLPALALKTILPISQLELTSTLQWHHICFCTTMVDEAMVLPSLTTSTNHLPTCGPTVMTNTLRTYHTNNTSMQYQCLIPGYHRTATSDAISFNNSSTIIKTFSNYHKLEHQ